MFTFALRLSLQSYIPLFILGVLAFPLLEGHQGAPWEFCLMDAPVFKRKLNKPTMGHNRALDTCPHKPQHCFATEIRLLWVEAVYSREVVVNRLI